MIPGRSVWLYSLGGKREAKGEGERGGGGEGRSHGG